MDTRSLKRGEYFDMIYCDLEIENQVDLSKVLLAKWNTDFLARLISITADPETGKTPISQDQLAKLAGVSQKTISNLLNPDRDPAWSSVQKVGEALGVHFVADYSGSINNEVVLEQITKRNIKNR
jgi:DNA-binding XRE family transcriptional regulator